ncbi:hypothetical protein OPT61_g2962 [Boeremia exigua]|uniref:Uncharacterized protein n=1 Tax=Boeremia exigua TaxID=749465 RepID=A0ACC2IJK3_9PLEO|nr:hypothetical protein OPT61_g2962 [Boeremia exigua]
MPFSGSTWFLAILAVLIPIFLRVQTGNDDFEASLSSRASLIYPDSKEFANASLRWSAANTPTYSLIVQVATEADVQKTILHANQQCKPFLAISGGHGQTSTIKNVQQGIGIYLGRINNISIVDNGRSVIVGGGVLNGNLVRHLWSRGKQTSSTGCDCVGYIAPVLGGGHGWLQGLWGLAADQLLSARLVLANGTALTVSDSNNPDLFWAIRGAGHNFGIVTEAKLKIYDVEPDQKLWAASGFVFTQDKLETVVSIANQVVQDPDRPRELTYYLLTMFNAQIDEENPVIIVWIYYQGSLIPTKFTDPLYSLGPATVDTRVTDLIEVNAHIQANKDGSACAKGFSRAFRPVSLQSYDVPSTRKAFDIFASVPSSFRNSVILFENYATNGVESIDANSTAVSARHMKLVITPLLTYPANASLDAIAEDFNYRIREALVEGSGSELVAYVNYARGDESLEAVYGYEPWRLEKLRRLKKEYDPFDRFNYYVPIS